MRRDKHLDSRVEHAPLQNMQTNAPIYAFGMLTLLIVGYVVLIVTGHKEDSIEFWALILASTPGLTATLFAERAARDIRNGVVQDKARRGAEQAINKRVRDSALYDENDETEETENER